MTRGAINLENEVAPRCSDMGGGSARSLILASTLRLLVKPVLSIWAKNPHLPWPTGLVDYFGILVPPIEGTVCTPVLLANCNAEWIRTQNTTSDHVVLYMHGGAFVCCGLRTHRRMTSRISKAAGAPILSVNYRMMPSNPISHAVEDGVEAYRYLLDRGYLPEQIFLGGDSAGGYLAFMVALTLPTLDLPVPAGVFALSPLTDMDPTRKLEHRNASCCAVFPSSAVPALTSIADRVDGRVVVEGVRGPRVSPVDADLTLMPPVLIQAGSTEIVLPDAELMAARLAEAGVDCELQVWKNQVHVFQAADFVPESQQAIDAIGTFVRANATV